MTELYSSATEAGQHTIYCVNLLSAQEFFSGILAITSAYPRAGEEPRPHPCTAQKKV